MSTLVTAKREWYRQPEIAAAYDRQRFGGASGTYVNEREIRIVAELLPRRASVIVDVACGTGRLLPLLRSRAATVLGIDGSMAMLGQICDSKSVCHSERGEESVLEGRMLRSAQHDKLLQADAFKLPLRDGACDAVTSIRLLFHLDDLRPILAELRRITKPGGTFVCDTSAWSPRSLLPLGRERWGDRVVPLSGQEFRRLAQAAGWRVRQERAAFLISPYMYRRLPLPLPLALEQLERHLPRQLLCRRFWSLEAA